MKNILILCTGNSCRSQIAHGFFQKYAGEKAHIYSAGVETHGVNPKAISIMKEIGINLSKYTSNHMDEYVAIDFDYIITVCDSAKERCPVFPVKTTQIHRNFTDPAGKDIEAFRKVRGEIEVFAKAFLKEKL
ncbi:MAG: arsenate reductase [Paraglaciecola sp.]|jgi:arsenate reductase